VQTVKATLIATISIVALVVSPLPTPAGENGSPALTISIDGALGPAAASYAKDALAAPADRHPKIVVLRLNTPGGIDRQSMAIGSVPNNKDENHQGRHDID